ncbi:LysR family transcriptional regulator [Bradyrhizobium glycinis]|uniref:LysR family transcriptional regulator n=1 Tax=Bradyrhizobium glycinis TaxID=2751812 RepID=UPI0018D948E4|nr:LysR family transcriptional regulator [Bradyrhizobium glycinis]MBH5372230.1 LysR family transcriptional regulator [Bradyrhizobium glycinis]
MRFKGLDLNLLVALDALMTERNLTAAARKINLSQPAMSAAVARLRTYFRDELFAMKGRELVPTSRAEELAAPVREAMMHIELSIIARTAFDPAQSKRCFRIGLSDFTTIVLFRSVVERAAREAPAVSFELVPPTQHDELLRRGEVDFVILPEFFLSNAHPRAALFEERLVCVGCCTNNELLRRLTFDRYMSMGHVAVNLGGTRKRPVDESFLLDFGLNRRIEVLVQSFSMIPPLLLGTNRIGTMPLRLAKHYQNTMPLRIAELPQLFPAFTEAVQWPVLHDSDPESLWMREILLQEATRMATAQEPSMIRSLEPADAANVFARSGSPSS